MEDSCVEKKLAGKDILIIRGRWVMMRIFLVSVLALFCGCGLLRPIEIAGPVVAKDPMNETIEERDARMAWWRAARFGMFIHWGIYSVPGGLYQGDIVDATHGAEWIQCDAPVPDAVYAKYADAFNPRRFNADEWVRIARDVGMKYLVITSKHHDGFSMFDSAQTEYDVVDVTPWGKDPMVGLAKACKKYGVKLGFYYSQLDWHHPAQMRNSEKMGREQYRYNAMRPGRKGEYLSYMKAQLRELVEKYDPAIFFFDGEWTNWWTQEDGVEITRFLREMKPSLIINNRVGKRNREDGDYGTPEQKIPATGLGYDWETCMTINGSWGYKSYDQNWKTGSDIIQKLVDIVSKGGNFLLNIGPTGEGNIPSPSLVNLAEVARWMEGNSESIHGAGASPFPSLRWGRCTTKPGKLFLHIFDWPGVKLELPAVENRLKKVYFLLDKKKRPLSFFRSGNKIIIDIPSVSQVLGDTVLVVELEGEPVVMDLPDAPTARMKIAQQEDDTITLAANQAFINSKSILYEHGGGRDNIGRWTDADDYVEWFFYVLRPRKFNVQITYACAPEDAGSKFEVVIGEKKWDLVTEATASEVDFVTRRLGTIVFDKADRFGARVRTSEIKAKELMNLQSIILTPYISAADEDKGIVQ